MMNIEFFKYQGAGNDFIFLFDENKSLLLQQVEIEKMCDRHFGIGADGLIILSKDETSDFYMQYFNSDGKESTMCGNGGRCAVHFAHFLGLIKKKTNFRAIDGLHQASILSDGLIELGMNDVQSIDEISGALFLNTGSPHIVIQSEDIDSLDIRQEALPWRLDEAIHLGGSNVNFIEKIFSNRLKIRTFERGVEDETLACGTGVTAAALTLALKAPSGMYSVLLEARGGLLKVDYTYLPDHSPQFTQIKLTGPAEQVFSGKIAVR